MENNFFKWLLGGLAVLITLQGLPLIFHQGQGDLVAAMVPGLAGIPGIALMALLGGLVLVWAMTAAALGPWAIKERVARLFHWLRRFAPVYFLFLLLYASLMFVVWLRLHLLGNRDIERFFVLVAAWFLVLVAGFGTDKTELAATAGPLIGTVSVILIVFGLELFMRYAFIQSDGFGISLMHLSWVNRYWNPINELGYRDYPVNEDQAVQHLLVVGDSFVAGQGVEDIDDTFPHQLANRLGAGYAVNIAAHNGLETAGEWDALTDYPVIPDIVILSHYFNDILSVAPEIQDHIRHEWLPYPEDEPLRSVVLNSYLANFIYWHIAQLATMQEDYTAIVLGLYDDPETWAAHEALLARFVDWAETNNAQLAVITWPTLTDISRTGPASAQVANFFAAHGVPVVNMAEVLAGRSAASLVANPFDAHPDESVHALAADELYEVVAPLLDAR